MGANHACCAKRETSEKDSGAYTDRPDKTGEKGADAEPEAPFVDQKLVDLEEAVTEATKSKDDAFNANEAHKTAITELEKKIALEKTEEQEQEAYDKAKADAEAELGTKKTEAEGLAKKAEEAEAAVATAEQELEEYKAQKAKEEDDKKRAEAAVMLQKMARKKLAKGKVADMKKEEEYLKDRPVQKERRKSIDKYGQDMIRQTNLEKRVSKEKDAEKKAELEAELDTLKKANVAMQAHIKTLAAEQKEEEAKLAMEEQMKEVEAEIALVATGDDVDDLLAVEAAAPAEDTPQ